jgi:hypothetical protein
MINKKLWDECRKLKTITDLQFKLTIDDIDSNLKLVWVHEIRQEAIKWINYCNKKGSKIQGEFESGLYTSKADILKEFFEIKDEELK